MPPLTTLPASREAEFDSSLRTLPPPHPALRVSIGIPARDEAETIEATLASIAAQTVDGDEPLPAEWFETIVFANGCTDGTAERVRAFAARNRSVVYVAEGTLPADRAHVGTARRCVMEISAGRLERVGRPRGTIATTDADTIAHPRWIVETQRALATADAVGGRIFVSPQHARELTPALRRAIASEERHRFAMARVESLCDPLAWDPWPRHGQHYAASLALRADTYRAAGGLPAVPCLEDIALHRALFAIDARFTHSLRVRVATSPRLDPRATGGFGTHIARLEAAYAAGAAQAVEPPDLTVARLRTRGVLRRWHRLGSASVSLEERRLAARTLDVAETELTVALRDERRFGAAFVRLEAAAEARGAFARRATRIERATEALEDFARAGTCRG